MTFEAFLWGRFASYFNDVDNYKNSQGKGLFQRYLSIFGLELDQQIIPAIEGFLDELDPNTAADAMLTNISWSVGSPDDIMNDTQLYRNLLVQIISIYQIKGTFRSYQYLFAIFGLGVQITEKYLGANQYDAGNQFDDGVMIYDDDPCSKNCVHYDLCYYNLPDHTLAPLSSDLQAKFRSMITSILEPHSAELDNLTYGCAGPATQVTIRNLTDANIVGYGYTESSSTGNISVGSDYLTEWQDTSDVLTLSPAGDRTLGIDVFYDEEKVYNHITATELPELGASEKPPYYLVRLKTHHDDIKITNNTGIPLHYTYEKRVISGMPTPPDAIGIISPGQTYQTEFTQYIDPSTLVVYEQYGDVLFPNTEHVLVDATFKDASGTTIDVESPINPLYVTYGFGNVMDHEWILTIH